MVRVLPARLWISPIFRRSQYATGDFTQYLDAIQRAEFWKSISTTSPNNHQLLGRPKMKPTATLTVPLAVAHFQRQWAPRPQQDMAWLTMGGCNLSLRNW